MSPPGSEGSGAAPHLVLVGLPGAGKTTVGAALAARLGRGFLDFDAEIERLEGRSVAEIFAADGEPYFRERERALTRDVRARDGMVLSPGGGWIMNADVVALLRPPARLVYLRVSPDTALRRLGAATSTRPLLARADALAELERLAIRRQTVYESADAVVETERLSLAAVVDTLAALATRWEQAYVTGRDDGP